MRLSEGTCKVPDHDDLEPCPDCRSSRQAAGSPACKPLAFRGTTAWSPGRTVAEAKGRLSRRPALRHDIVPVALAKVFPVLRTPTDSRGVVPTRPTVTSGTTSRVGSAASSPTVTATPTD